jgi:hypothetical protein
MTVVAWAGVAVGAAGLYESSKNSGGGGGASTGGYKGGSYLPPNLPQAAVNETALIPQLGNNNLYGSYVPSAEALANDANASPFYQQSIYGAQNAAGYGAQQAGQMAQGANQLYGQMGQVPGLENQLVQSSFDPQHQLYAYMQAQNENQTNADLASRGLNMSGAGGQIAAQQNQLFNQNWQNNQLQRQMQGVRGVGALNQSAGQLGTVGANMGTQATNLMNQSSSLPYQAQLYRANQLMGLYNQAGQIGQQAQVPTQQMISDYNQYQGLGSASSQLGQQGMVNSASNQYGQFLQQNAKPIGNAIGTAISSWGSGMNDGTSGWNSVGNSAGNSGDYLGTGSGYNPYFQGPPS